MGFFEKMFSGLNKTRVNLEELEESVKSESEEKAFEAAKDEVLNGRDETLITETKDAPVENETL